MREDSWDKPKNDWCWGRVFSLAASKQRSVAVGNKVMDTRLPQPAGCGDKYDICSVGRSMIEMLGVLAIVGVLSVGGIAGYSKAMTMWKIDKWKDNFTMMMTNLKVTFSNSRSYNNGAPGVNMVTFFKEINVIPDNMLDEDNKDLFGNILSIYAPKFSPEWNRLTFMFFMPPNKESVEVCKAFFSLTPDFRNMWTATLNDNLKIGNYELCGYGVPAEIAKEWNCKYYKDGILPQIAQSCAICSQYSCDLKLIISNNN